MAENIYVQFYKYQTLTDMLLPNISVKLSRKE